MTTSVTRGAASVAAGLLLLAGFGGAARAQEADPLGLIATAAVMPYFNAAPGNVFVLLLASPVAGNPSLHLTFYSPSCTTAGSEFVPMSKNDSEAVPIDATVTPLTEGAILISATSLNPLFVRGLWFDLANNRTRVVDPAAAALISDQGFVPGETWSPYDSGAAIAFAPPDDGVTFTDEVIFSCPGGNLINAMADLMAFDSFAIQVTPITLSGVVYDLDEHPQADWLHPCRCVGLNIPPDGGTWLTTVRLSQMHSAYATIATYTEIRSSAGSGGAGARPFMGYLGITFDAGAGFRVDIFGRLHHGPAAAFTAD